MSKPENTVHSRLAGVLALSLAIGCSPRSGIPIDEAPEEIGSAICSFTERCGISTFIAVLSAFRPTDCARAFGAQQRDGIFPPLLAALDAGTVVYDAMAAQACVDEIRALACESIDFSRTDARTRTCGFVGLLSDGERCSLDQECSATSACHGPPETGTCSLASCQHIPQLGEPCTDSCGDEGALLCIDGTCAAPVPIGGVCSGGVRACVAHSSCSTTTAGESGVCQVLAPTPIVGEGASCTAEAQCDRGLVCVGASLEVAVCAQRRTDGTCRTTFWSTNDCGGFGETCVAGRCVPPPGEGEPCRISCQPDLACSGGFVADGVCERRSVIGEACTTSAGCFSGTCTRVCVAPGYCR